MAASAAAWGVESSSFADEARSAVQAETTALSTPVEIQGMVLPNVADGPSAAQGAVLGQAGSHFNQTQHLDVTRWLTPEATNAWGRFGLSMGLSAPAPGAAALPLANASVTPTNLDWGMRWRSRLTSGRHLDITAWTRAPQWAQKGSSRFDGARHAGQASPPRTRSTVVPKGRRAVGAAAVMPPILGASTRRSNPSR